MEIFVNMDDNASVTKFQQLTTSAFIDVYHNESALWDTTLNASEEEYILRLLHRC
mgnify:FL=1